MARSITKLLWTPIMNCYIRSQGSFAQYWMWIFLQYYRVMPPIVLGCFKKYAPLFYPWVDTEKYSYSMFLSTFWPLKWWQLLQNTVLCRCVSLLSHILRRLWSHSWKNRSSYKEICELCTMSKRSLKRQTWDSSRREEIQIQEKGESKQKLDNTVFRGKPWNDLTWEKH